MAEFSSSIGFKSPGEMVKADDINILLSSAPPIGMTDIAKDDNGRLVFFRSLGREVTLTWNDDSQLIRVDCYIVAQSITVYQTVEWSDDGIPTLSDLLQL